MSDLTVILKVTERCNLNCSYCYYFNGLDQSFKSRPAALTRNVLNHVIQFLLDGINHFAIEKLNISLHGGEPLLLNKIDFEYICNQLRLNLEPKLDKLNISTQTNGTLINDFGIDIFEKYNIKVGISIDGTRKHHDEFRIDHKNKGSYEKIVKSINLLHKRNFDFGILSVIDPTQNAREIFYSFVQELGATGMDFLLPDFNHNTIPISFSPENYGKFMIDLLDTWIENNNPEIKIRFLQSSINVFLGSDGLIYGQGLDKSIKNNLHIISIRSDGDLGPSDELMSTDPQTVTLSNANVSLTSMKEYLKYPIFNELSLALTNSPTECLQCCWYKTCGGGNLVNRFSEKKRFNNPSIYCNGLKLFYSKILKELISNGISSQVLANNLLG